MTTARLATRTALCALAVVVAGTAVARERRANHGRADIRRARTEALTPPEQPAAGTGLATAAAAPEEAAPPAFAFDLLTTFSFNSNAEAARGGGAALEAMPEARLSCSRRHERLPLRFSALVDTGADRYGRRPHADADLAFGRLRVQTESGQDDQELQAFVSYSPQATLLPVYARRAELRHDLNIGLDRQFNFDAGWRRLPPGPATAAAAVWSFDINAALQRRAREPGAGSYAVLVNPSVSYTHSPEWSGSLEIDITQRWYDREQGRLRRERLTTPVLTLEYTPPDDWFAGSRVGSPVVNLQVFFARQASNQAEARFSQWGAGPVLRTGWKF